MAAASTSERIVVVLEGPACDTALEAAAHLAARRGARLIGLVVEDIDLLTAAGLPFAREIGPVSGISRPLSTIDLEARLADRAARLRRSVARFAERHGIEAELEVGRGRRAQTVLAQTRPDDLLILCRTHGPQRPDDVLAGVMAEATCTVMLIGPHGGRALHAPMVLLDGTEGALRALGRALALSRDERRMPTLVVAPGIATGVRERALRLLADQGVGARFIDLLRLDAVGVLRAVRRERPELLFIARESPLFVASEGRRLREELDELPLVVVP